MHFTYKAHLLLNNHNCDESFSTVAVESKEVVTNCEKWAYVLTVFRKPTESKNRLFFQHQLLLLKEGKNFVFLVMTVPY